MKTSCFAILAALAAVGCGSLQDDYHYTNLDPGTMDVLYAPGQSDSASPIESTNWNCGLRAIALLRQGASNDWDWDGLSQYVATDLPIRDWFGWEGMGSPEMVATAQRAGLRARLNQNTAWEDLWETVEAGDAAVILTQDGSRENAISETKAFHWVAVTGIAQSKDGEQFLIVAPLADGQRKLLPRSDFRRLVWWHADGMTESVVTGAGIRPGTSLRISYAHLQ